MLPFLPAHRLAQQPEGRRWLIDGLWADEAVGIVGGEPKCCKSFLALDMAVAVATGSPCLRHFSVPRPGRVLLFAAEDALHVVRQRLDGICHAADATLDSVDVQVITAPSVRLDLDSDRKALAETIDELRPRLLILDPFVRLHRVDENVSGEVAPLLAFLRELQRRFHLAVVLVHHARKGAGKERAGQALRGSSEFHAWGDSNLYLRRREEQLLLSIEHRAAPSRTGISLQLRAQDDSLALEICTTLDAPQPAPPRALDEQIRAALEGAGKPLAVADLQRICRVRTSTLCDALAELTASGRVRKAERGYQLTG
jgi:AAA domain-containing protein